MAFRCNKFTKFFFSSLLKLSKRVLYNSCTSLRWNIALHPLTILCTPTWTDLVSKNVYCSKESGYKAWADTILNTWQCIDNERTVLAHQTSWHNQYSVTISSASIQMFLCVYIDSKLSNFFANAVKCDVWSTPRISDHLELTMVA